MGSYRDQNDIVFISHGDDLPAAELVRDLVKARFGMDSFLINYVGPHHWFSFWPRNTGIVLHGRREIIPGEKR